MKPTLTVSGYRGIWGETLTLNVAREYTRAFGAYVSKRNGHTILVGRDGRESGPAILEAVTNELLALGFDVVILGMMPTPTVVFLVRELKADGAIIITASHNPIEYNGLKFVTASGAFTNEAEVKEIEASRGEAHAGVFGAVEDCSRERSQNTAVETSLLRERGSADKTNTPACASPRDGTNLFDLHLQKLLSNIDVASIKNKNFKVALDPINSVGCTTTPKLLDALGVTYTLINGEPSGKFAHAPEPIAQNLTTLETLVKIAHADIGFAQDPDGDRLVLVDETGTMISEELMLALCVKAVLEKTRGDIALNVVTSTASEAIAQSYGGRAWRSKVGEANVVEMMRAHNAVIGGEGSGGVIWPVVNMARDSFVGIALILELMARHNTSISSLVAELPSFCMAKDKVARTGELADIYARLKNTFPEAKALEIDGLRLDLPDGSWVNIRPSNTEPIIRIFAESTTADRATALLAQAKSSLI